MSVMYVREGVWWSFCVLFGMRLVSTFVVGSQQHLIGSDEVLACWQACKLFRFVINYIESYLKGLEINLKILRFLLNDRILFSCSLWSLSTCEYIVLFIFTYYIVLYCIVFIGTVFPEDRCLRTCQVDPFIHFCLCFCVSLPYLYITSTRVTIWDLVQQLWRGKTIKFYTSEAVKADIEI